MSIIRMCPNPTHLSEFWGGYTGTCGETALTVALASAFGIVETIAQESQYMLAMTQDMKSKGWASANGASTIWDLAQEVAVKHGVIFTNWAYQEPFQHDWHAEILAQAGIRPIVMQVATAGAGLPGDETGVHYHFICILGLDTLGYWVADGDNWAANQNLVLYSYADLNAATPCGMLVLDIINIGGTSVVPAGWTDANGIITAPNGKNVQHGFADFIRTNAWSAADEPITEELQVATVVESDTRWGYGSLQYFQDSVLAYAPTPDKAVASGPTVMRAPTGAELLFARTGRDAALATVQKLDALNASLQAQIDTLEKQIAINAEGQSALAALIAFDKALQAAIATPTA